MKLIKLRDKDITTYMHKDTLFYKVESGENIKEKYNVIDLPSLLIFKNKNYLGKVDGYYNIEQKEEFIEKIKIPMLKNCKKC